MVRKAQFRQPLPATLSANYYMVRKAPLTIEALQKAANAFSTVQSKHDEPSLFGVTDGKAIGTHLEHKFSKYLSKRFEFEEGSSAMGIDFLDIEVDMKVTRLTQPQSSCPFKSARQKIYGLGYSLLVFVYVKQDDVQKRTSRLDIKHTIFIDKSRTGDYQTTRGLIDILNRDANRDDILAFLADRNLPIEEIEANRLTGEILSNPPEQGYLTISNALQWRLQYGRVIDRAGKVDGIVRVS